MSKPMLGILFILFEWKSVRACDDFFYLSHACQRHCYCNANNYQWMSRIKDYIRTREFRERMEAEVCFNIALCL
jgi:hypothetical protein